MTRIKRHITRIGGCLLAAGSIACGSTAHNPIDARLTPQPAPPHADSAAIHAFWATLDSTWIARDAVRFSRLFTEDASFGFVGRGTSLETRAAIQRRFTTQFRRQDPDLRHMTEIRRIHPLAADLVAIDGEVRVLNARPGGSSPSLLRRFAITGVMVHTSGGWLVRLLRVFQLPTTPESVPADSSAGRDREPEHRPPAAPPAPYTSPWASNSASSSSSAATTRSSRSSSCAFDPNVIHCHT